MPQVNEIRSIMERARQAAVDYYQAIGKPLGITGEYGENVAADRLGLKLVDARTAGYDAIDARCRKIQIKTRSIPRKKMLSNQMLGSIRLDHEWDVVVLVIMNELYEVQSMFEAERDAIEVALTAPGSKARNERGALSLAKFKSIGRQVWPISPSSA